MANEALDRIAGDLAAQVQMVKGDISATRHKRIKESAREACQEAVKAFVEDACTAPSESDEDWLSAPAEIALRLRLAKWLEEAK